MFVAFSAMREDYINPRTSTDAKMSTIQVAISSNGDPLNCCCAGKFDLLISRQKR